MAGSEPEWQCVMILWGTKYPVGLVNHQVEMIRRLSSRPARFVLISDRPRDGLDPAVRQLPFDPFFLNPKFLGRGCQAKLTMFADGLIAQDLPAIFVDLDTVIVGDLSRLLNELDRPDRIRMLAATVLPFGPISRFSYWLTMGRRYARGNSSVVLWHPASGAEIAERFKAMFAERPGLDRRQMVADDKFISWCVRRRIGTVPRSIAVKFSNDFMHVSRLWLAFKARLPWIRARRANLAAVTLPGDDIKPERLLELADGDLLRDRKGRWLIWSDAAMGGLKEQIRRYYSDRPDAA